MSPDRTHRKLAKDSLARAAAQIGVLPHGPVPNERMIATYTAAQAHATIAIAQALLDLADAVRSTGQGVRPAEGDHQ